MHNLGGEIICVFLVKNCDLNAPKNVYIISMTIKKNNNNFILLKTAGCPINMLGANNFKSLERSKS